MLTDFLFLSSPFTSVTQNYGFYCFLFPDILHNLVCISVALGVIPPIPLFLDLVILICMFKSRHHYCANAEST